MVYNFIIRWILIDWINWNCKDAVLYNLILNRNEFYLSLMLYIVQFYRSWNSRSQQVHEMSKIKKKKVKSIMIIISQWTTQKMQSLDLASLEMNTIRKCLLKRKWWLDRMKIAKSPSEPLSEESFIIIS